MNCAPEVRVTGVPPLGLMIPRLTVAKLACSPKAIREPSGDQTGSLPVAPATCRRERRAVGDRGVDLFQVGEGDLAAVGRPARMHAVFGDDQRGGGGAVRVRDLDLVVRFGAAEDEGEPGAVRGPDRFLERDTAREVGHLDRQVESLFRRFGFHHEEVSRAPADPEVRDERHLLAVGRPDRLFVDARFPVVGEVGHRRRVRRIEQTDVEFAAVVGDFVRRERRRSAGRRKARRREDAEEEQLGQPGRRHENSP